MPTIPRVPKCCCCLSLNTGGLVLGWMGAIGSVLILLILSSILFIDYDEYVTEHFKDDREMLEQFLKFKPIVITSAIVIAIVYIIHLVVSILLIRGTMNVSIDA